jgi:uncharacterized protein YkwD
MPEFVSRLPLVALVVVALLVPGAAQTQGVARPDAAQVTRLVVEQTNAFRRSQGFVPTSPRNGPLAATAQEFAEYMARTDRYGHEADGRQPSQRASAHGYAWCQVAENIAWQYSSVGFGTRELAERFVEGWKRSPGHRRNMLEPDVTETAVAVAQSPRTGKYYAVQMFARPDSMRIAFRIANRSGAPLRYEVGGERFQLPPRVTRTHEQCRSEVLTVQLPGGEAPLRIEPRNGERYAIERDGPHYRLTRG